MKLSAALLPGDWYWIAHGVLAAVAAWVFRTAPWARLRDNAQNHLFLGSVVSLLVLWSIRPPLLRGIEFHFLGATALTLMFGPQLAIAALGLVMAGLALAGHSEWTAYSINVLVLAVLPTFVSRGVHMVSDRVLPQNIFVFIFVPAFLGGAIALALGAGITFLGGFLQTMAAETDENAIRRVRNFYGILKVTEKEDLVGLKRTLTNGQICHGFQYMDEDKRRWTTSYYGPQSGFGLAMTHHPRRGSPEPHPRDLRLGVVGLGTGSTAAYGREGDYIRFYDINADVKMLAENYFSYLLDCPAPVDVILGDARISLESELARGEAQEFDVLAIDAFTSDSIPIHLLTRECAEIYWRHLKPDGLLLLHISNRFLDLEPVALGLKESLGCQAVLVSSSDDDEFGIYSASWVILTNNDEFLAIPEVVDRISEWPEIRGKPCEPLQWTDSFASLWQVVDFGWKWPPSWLPDFLRGKESR